MLESHQLLDHFPYRDVLLFYILWVLQGIFKKGTLETERY